MATYIKRVGLEDNVAEATLIAEYHQFIIFKLWSEPRFDVIAAVNQHLSVAKFVHGERFCMIQVYHQHVILNIPNLQELAKIVDSILLRALPEALSQELNWIASINEVVTSIIAGHVPRCIKLT